jgi:hypothetical protein
MYKKEPATGSKVGPSEYQLKPEKVEEASKRAVNFSQFYRIVRIQHSEPQNQYFAFLIDIHIS